jgi:uncharacterized protein YjbI with pentapeptide repeats
LPATLIPRSAADLLADDEHEGIELVDADLSGRHVTALSLEAARLKSCRFDGAELRRLRCRQTVFENCDFANSRWLDCELAEVAFVDCRFTGASIAGGRLGQLLVRDCRLRLARLSHLGRPSGVFERCDFGGALLMESDLSDLHLTDCDFRDAELFNVDLGGSDLRGNELDGLRGVGCLRGATIDDLQLLGLGPALAAHVGLVLDEGPAGSG